MQAAWLEAFVAIADHRSFAAAAASLYRGQGRVSSYIGSLENELGVRLFDRSQRPVSLTAEGEAYLPHARAALESLSAGRSAARALKGRPPGVSIAAHPSASSFYLPEVLVEFAKHQPEVSVNVVERDIRMVDAALDSGEVQIALRPTIPEISVRQPLEYQPLWREPIVAVVPHGHPAAERSHLTAQDLAGEPLVVGGRRTEDTELIPMLTDIGVEPHIRHVSPQPQSMIALVRLGMAIGVINRMALQGVDLSEVVQVPISPELDREVGLYWTGSVGPSGMEARLLRTIIRTPPPEGCVDLRGSAVLRHPDMFDAGQAS